MVQKKLGDYGGEKKKASKPAKLPKNRSTRAKPNYGETEIPRRHGMSVRVRSHWRSR